MVAILAEGPLEQNKTTEKKKTIKRFVSTEIIVADDII